MEDSAASCPCQRYRQGDNFKACSTSSSKMNFSSARVFCKKCTHALLHHSISQHKSALALRQQKRQECDQTLRQLRSSVSSVASISSTLSPRGQAQKQQQQQDIIQVPRSAHQIILQYQQRIEQLNRDIELIRKECARKSVALASYAMIQSNRSNALEEQRQIVHQLRSHLDALHNVVIIGQDSDDCEKKEEMDNCVKRAAKVTSPVDVMNIGPIGLEGTMDYYIGLVQKRRFQLALEAFEMHRMDVGSEYNQLTFHDLLQQEEHYQEDDTSIDIKRNHNPTTSAATSIESKRFHRLVQQRVPSGIGKIGGLLMPHRGPLHFHGVLPCNILVSSLRMIASLTSLLARCLSIELPHPIVLCPMAKSLERQQECNVNPRVVGRRGEELWLRDQTADIMDASFLPENCNFEEYYKCSNDDDQDEEVYKDTKCSRSGVTLMKHLDDLVAISNLTSSDVRHDKSAANGNETNHGQVSKHSLAPKLMRQCPSGTSVKQSSSASSLMSLVESSSKLISHSARRAFDKMTGHHHHHHPSQGQQRQTNSKSSANVATVAMDGDAVALRVKFASCAIIYESTPGENVSNTRYELRPPSAASANQKTREKTEEQFAIGLQLLQNDIIALSLKAGVPISMLWPADAMCLNLQSLKLFLSQTLDA